MSAKPVQFEVRCGICLTGCAAAAIISAVFLWWTGHVTNRWIRGQLLHETWHATESINIARVDALRSKVAGAPSPEYDRLLRHLVNTRPLIAGCTRLSIIHVDPGRTHRILVDSQSSLPPDESSFSRFMADHPELSDDILPGIARGQRTILHDRNHSRICVLAPLTDPASGCFVAVVHIEFDGRAWSSRKSRAMAWPVAWALGFTGLCTALAFRFCRRQRRTTDATEDAPGAPRDSRVLILLLGATVTTAITQALYRAERQEEHAVFSDLVHRTTLNITDALQSLRDVRMESLVKFIEGSENVTDDEFARFTQFLLNDLSVLGWGWAGPEPAPGAPADRPRTFLVRRFTSSLPHLHGTDTPLGAIPEFRAALDTALRTGLISASDPVVLPVPWPQEPLMGVFLPVHGTDPGHANHGVVFAVLSWPAMAERAINMMEPEDSHLFLSIRQHDGVNHDVELAKLSGKPEFPIERPPPPPEHPSWHTRPIQAFGKTISIRAAPAGHSIQVGAHFGSRTAAGAGILITLVAAMFVRSIENRGHILRREVRRQTMELQKSEAFARSTLDGLSAQIAILGSDGTILAVNRAWQGYAKSGAGLLFSAREGENYLRVCDDSLAAGHAEAGNISAAIRAAIEGTAHPDGIEFHLHARHGDRWLEARVTPFPGAEPARAILAYEDITARRKAEESERKLSSAVEQSPAMVMIIDTRGRIEYANSRFTEVTGYRLEDIRGREIRVVMADDIPADITREIDRAQAEGRVWHGEFQNRRRDGEPFWHRVTISPLRDITGRITHFTAVGEDVTEQRNLENLLLQAQKMETVGRLAGGIAHDFNNLLQIILGSVDFALMDTPPAADIRGDLEEIKRAAEKSAALTRQLLAFARKQTIQPRVLDLNDTISNMTKMLRRLIGDQIQLEFHPGDPVPPVKMDPAQIDQLLANLVVNARDAIQPPGEITISTQAEDLRVGDGERAGDRPAGRYVRMTVRDTGVGMDARTQSRIFEPFFTTKASGVGTGLGLSTVYGIVEQNRGFIRVNSKLGQGTTFDIYIPATAEAAPTDGAAIAITGGHETILLVEDHPQVLKSVQTMLQGLGYTVLATSDPDDARRWAQTQGMAMDLLLSDLVMPNINGRDLAEVIRAHRPDLPCLFMSGYTADIMGADGIMSSKIFFLEKPFTQSALAHKVREALDHPNTHSPSAASSGHPPAGAGGA